MNIIKVKDASKLTCAVHAAQWVYLQYVECSSLFEQVWLVERVGGGGGGGGNVSIKFFEKKWFGVDWSGSGLHFTHSLK
jgi:hypothetical protein